MPEARAAIEEFLATCRKPAFLETGEVPMPLAAGCFTLEQRGGRLFIEAWDETRNVSRRIAGAGQVRPGRLEVTIERFGKRQNKAIFVDQARPGSETVARQGRRQVFREQFRRFLRRQFPGWKLSAITTESDLEHTLSPAYPRSQLAKGNRGWAAIGASGDSGNPSDALAFGLIWLDYLRRRERRTTIEGLVLYLPAGDYVTTCLRMRWLDPRLARYLLYVHREDGGEERLDPQDHGNLRSLLDPWREAVPDLAADLARRLDGIAGVSIFPAQDGSASIRVRGLEVARVIGGQVWAGLDRKRPIRGDPAETVLALASELSRIRSPEASGRHPLQTRLPEAWLESQVREHVSALDPDLLPTPVYGQVPAVTGLDRGVLDLLAVDRNGRLAVLELKATADLQLPLQALDYWMRVRHHALAGEFSPRGYFPGVALSALTPRLKLVAPALEFHPTSETLLRFLDPGVPVDRIGLGEDWRRSPRVVFRVTGAAKPGW